MHFVSVFFIIFDKNIKTMKKIKFILPAWDAENNKPFDVDTEIELTEERADEAIRLGVAVEVKKKQK